MSPRSCPGSHVALSLLFLVAASTLVVFDISEDIDNEGRPIQTNLEWHSGIIRFDLIFETAFQHTLIIHQQRAKTLQMHYQTAIKKGGKYYSKATGWGVTIRWWF